MTDGMNYLGFDWGAAKIGVAIAHAETRLALAYGALKNDEEIMEEIGILIEKEGIGTVVIGVHVNDTFVAKHEGEALGERLAKQFAVRVAYQDEMFTSKMAQGNLVAQGYRKVATLDDAEAARILLQSFLDKSASLSLSNVGDL